MGHGQPMPTAFVGTDGGPRDTDTGGPFPAALEANPPQT